MEEPKSIEFVSNLENCSVRAVQKWAAKNGIRKLGTGKNSPYIFYDEDIERFHNREGPGRPWPEKE